jgi:valyl-tRNA synthetase
MEDRLKDLPPQYNPKEVEKKWFEFWANTPLLHASIETGKRPFCIVIPPPNVTGILHMGHALNNTMQDVLIRARRMQGSEALWMPGTDHAGIATQNVVERQLAKEGLKRQDLGREEFLKRVWQWKREYGSTIIHQLKRMGATCDWQRERFTMDKGYSEAVQEVFVRLYEKGLIYRGDYIINWCPRCQTALSDEEAPHHELDGKLYYIKYPLKESPAKKSKTVDHIVVATTRPETMLGDTAVAVHPTDKRYKHLVGEILVLPLLEREIKIIADPLIDKKFGTGAVKVTPAHDPNDYLMGRAHHLEFINIMRPDGILNTNAGEYSGMDRFEAREAIIEDLRERKLLVKIEAHKHAVGHCYRCHTIIEPYLSKQWFVKMKPLARPAIAAVKKGRIKFTPKRWTKVYLNWMGNIKDWCISRQIWWGHRLPVYYCKGCLESLNSKLKAQNSKIESPGVIVARIKPEKCPVCGSANLEQDPDVLDTWFSSWLWPFAIFGWPFAGQASQLGSQASKEEGECRKTQDAGQKELDYFYPTEVLVTAPEIIFFWVARMIMAGCEFMGEIPFRDVYIHGTVRDEEGKKMSKSLGNSIDPLEVINDYGADALRFSLMAIAASGSDIFLSRERFEQGRNFSNKIWNASRFILMNLKEGASGEGMDKTQLRLEDRWILAELNTAIKKVDKALDAFRFNEAINVAYEFFWHKLCDWYLEIVKPRVSDKNTQEVLVYCLKKTLLLLHPFMPFITDEIFAKLPGPRPETITISHWPVADKALDDKEALRAMEMVRAIVFHLRERRHELKLPAAAKINVLIWTTEKKKKILEEVSSLLRHLAFVEQLEIKTKDEAPKNSLASLVARDLHLYVLLGGLVDIEKEKQRLDREIATFRLQLKQKETLLGNKNFIKRAPKEVVTNEKKRCQELSLLIEKAREVRDAFKQK